jgi:RNA polymerase sigma factor (sigma-70 family)
MQNNDMFIQEFLSGTSDALTKIYTTTYPFVEAYIVSHDGSKKDAEDVFHNALVLLFVKLKAGKLNIQSFDKYLFTVCRNLWRRENAKKRVTNLDTIPLVSEELDQASFYIEQEQWELYKGKFEKLSTQCQEILLMLFKKATYAAIVSKYNYASQTVARQRVFKCKTKLIKLIKSDTTYHRLKN